VRSFSRPSLARRSLAIALAIVILVAPSAFATPTNPDIDAKRAELDAANQELDRMATELSEMVEEYNSVSEALDQTRMLIETTREELAEAQAEVARAEGVLNDRAAQMYKGGSSGVLEMLLGTRSFEDFLVRVEWLVRLGQQDVATVAALEEARSRVEDAERALVAREAEQVTLRDQVRSKQLSIESTIDRQQAYISSLDSEIAELIREEEERQRRLAEERARKAAEEAARRQAAADSLGDRLVPGGTLPTGRAAVVDEALKYLGVRYQWGGASPSTGFDCSGLVQYCCAAIGVSVPRTSRSQFKVGTHIPPDRLDLLAAGDLVFFGTGGDPGRVHHVGIYVGDGAFIHAPQTGDVVRISSLVDRVAEKGDYVGASRL
jgi:cell wall-associated NlpC family hydrolase